MNTEHDAPLRPLVESLTVQLEALPFDVVAANEHYTAGGAENLKYRKQTIDQFLQDDELIEPDVQPRRYTHEEIDVVISKYESALDILVAQSDRTQDEDLLIDRLIKKSGELFRYEELMLAFGATAINDSEKHRKIAAELSMELIGGIDQPAFDELLFNLREEAFHSEQPFAKELLNLTGERPRPETAGQMFELDDATREVIGRDLVVLYPGLNELLSAETTTSVSPSEAISIFDELLKVSGLDDEWQTELNSGKAAETHTAAKIVTIGNQRAPFKNYREAVAVGFHECIVHAGRSEGVVHPGVGDFEEGIATRLQQIITGEKRTPGVQYYLAIGLQAGADRGGVPRSYRETFEIMWRREALQMEVSGSGVDVQKARAQAQRHVQRTRRGGEVDTHDASYFTGAQKAAQWLNQITRLPGAERRSLLAKVLTNKYDPTDPEQAAYINKHG